VSTPKLITPDVYGYTELMVGKECKRSLFTIVTIAANVTDRPLRSRK